MNYFSSNPDLNTSDQSSETKGRPGSSASSGVKTSGGHVSGVSTLATHHELGYPDNPVTSRPSSRQRQKKQQNNNNKNLSSHISQSSDQLLPAFYENVPTLHSRQKVLGEQHQS